MTTRKQNILTAFVFSLGFSLAAGAVYAHHSFPATYDMDAEPIMIEGILAQFLFRNPHSFVHVMVMDEESGLPVRWAVEWGGASALAGEVDPSALRPGAEVIITGNPGRNPDDHRLRMNRIEIVDGDFVWDGDFE